MPTKMSKNGLSFKRPITLLEGATLLELSRRLCFHPYLLVGFVQDYAKTTGGAFLTKLGGRMANGSWKKP